MDINKVETLQKKYGFSKIKSFDETKLAYKNMLHDNLVTKNEVQEELDKWTGKSQNPYISNGSQEAISARKELIAIVKNELKSRK